MNIRIDPQLKGFIGWYFVISSPVWCIFPFWALLGCLFWGNAGFPTKMTEDLRPQARKQMSPGRGKTNCWGELIYIEIWKKSTHTYMHIIAYLQMHQYIYILYNIIHTYATMILSGPSQTLAPKSLSKDFPTSHKACESDVYVPGHWPDTVIFSEEMERLGWDSWKPGVFFSHSSGMLPTILVYSYSHINIWVSL